MKGRKGSTDEGGVRSPAMISWPGKIKPGKQIKQIAAAIDLLPTLAGLAGIDYTPIKPLDGVSLRPLLLEESPKWEDRLIFNYWEGSISVRSHQYRLDNNGKLFNIEVDPGQCLDMSNQKPEIVLRLKSEAEKWIKEVASELPSEDDRPFSLGYRGVRYTQFPARDGLAHGNIKRSNQFPNASFFTNWKSVDDEITWDVEVVASGDFEVELYYTCPEEDIGSTLELSYAGSRVVGKVSKAHDPPLRGMENDRVERSESYVKDFKPLRLGTLHLKKGSGQLTLKALDIPGSQVMDFRLLMFTRLTK
jgi:hypothetical protein